MPIDSLERLLLFAVMISALIMLHEYAHLIIARKNGVRVTDFALGLGPTIFHRTSPRSGTTYRLNALPIGGYCSMKGEGPEKRTTDKVTAQNDVYHAKRPWQRLSIIVAGPVTNIMIAFVLLVVTYTVVGYPTPTTTLGKILPGPAQRAGLHMGDRIIRIDTTIVANGQQLANTIEHAAGKSISVVYERNASLARTTVTPIADQTGKGRIGFVKIMGPVRFALPAAITASAAEIVSVSSATIAALAGVFTAPAASAEGLQGVIGIAALSGQVADNGPGSYLNFTALISLSLGIFNLLPIPALDGGRAAFVCIEILRGKPVAAQHEAMINVGGLIALLLLMVIVSCHDVARIMAGKTTF